MHEGDLELVEKPSLVKAMKSFRYKSLIYRIVFLLMKKQITKITSKALDEFKCFKPDLMIDEGFDLNVYGLDASVIHAPGHTDGSIGIITRNGSLIAGDTFANMGKPRIAPNAIDFKALASSVKRLEGTNLKTVYLGHGEPFELEQLGKNI